MAASPNVLVSVEEYLSTVYEPDCDYVDGVVEERNVGEGPHSLLHAALMGTLGNVERQLNIRTWPSVRVRVSPTRYRVPDLCVTLGRGPVPRIKETPPLICLEVLSSEDRMPRVLKRADDSLAFGVAHIWIFDPLERVGYTYSSAGLKLSDDGIFTAPEIPLTINLADIFAEIDS
jgi:Uma2 family endonuclease